MRTSIATSVIQCVNGASVENRSDFLAVEEPLEIRLAFGPERNRQMQNLTVTMRTPGNDVELSLGFLFTEGIIASFNDVDKIYFDPGDENIVCVGLKSRVSVDLKKVERNFYSTSSCGVCGKASIDAVSARGMKTLEQQFTIPSELIQTLPEKLSQRQTGFDSTGGLHAVSLFNISGDEELTFEDVGRHNAFDKVIGAALRESYCSLSQRIALVSGRASFELVQKAIVSGIPVMAAVGAPSSLAVDLAKQYNMTLLGFVRGKRFNIYSGGDRIKIEHV